MRSLLRYRIASNIPAKALSMVLSNQTFWKKLWECANKSTREIFVGKEAQVKCRMSIKIKHINITSRSYIAHATKCYWDSKISNSVHSQFIAWILQEGTAVTIEWENINQDTPYRKRTTCAYVWTTYACVWNRLVHERQPEKARNLFQVSSNRQTAMDCQVPPSRKAYVFMSQSLRRQPWLAWWPKMGKIRLYQLSYELYTGWCFKSWPPFCTLWKHTAYVSHIHFYYIKYNPTCQS